MKKIKMILVAFLVVLGTFTSIVEAARQIGSFSNFKITTSYANTGYLSKNKKSNYVLNLEPSRHLAPMTVKNRLVNSNKDPRSDERLAWVGTRTEFDNWASVGYIYALSMVRQNWWDGAAYITGSWSPDN